MRFSPLQSCYLSKSTNSISLRAHFENLPCWHSATIRINCTIRSTSTANLIKIELVLFAINCLSTDMVYGSNLQSHNSPFSFSEKSSPFSMLDSLCLKIKQSISAHLISNFSNEKLFHFVKHTANARLE